MKTTEIHVGKIVSDVCKQRGYKYSEVAQKIGISKQTLNNRLKRNDWSVKDLFTISQAVGYDFVALFTQPTEDKERQETKVVLQIEIGKDKANEVLEYINDKQLYSILKQ